MNQNEIDQRVARIKGTQRKDYYQQQTEATARVQRYNAENGYANVTFPAERPVPAPAPVRVLGPAPEGMTRHDVQLPASARVMSPAVERKFRTSWSTAQNAAGTSNQPTLADLTAFLQQEETDQAHYDYIRSEAIRLGILSGRGGLIQAGTETHAQMQARLFAENVNRPRQAR